MQDQLARSSEENNTLNKIMDFQVASDLHIETHGGLNAPQSCYPVRSAPILALCGDVYPFSRPEYPEILRRVAEPFDMVMYVPGNHEYYGTSINSDRGIENTCFSVGNVVYMNKRSINIRGMQFIGATMWVNNPTDPPAALVMNDYSTIDGMTPKRSNSLHKDHKGFLTRAVNQAKKDGRVGAVVMTHHAPDDRLAFDISSRPPSTFPFYFATDMKSLTSDSFIKVWCHGHTHESYRTRLDPMGPIFASNALGYPSENTGYNRHAVFRIWSPEE